MTAPRVVFGMPAYNRPDSLPRTLESLLGQTYTDFAIVIVDDSPSPAIRSIVEEYAKSDSRITYEANPVRLGMIGNWHRAFQRAQATFPDSVYFAWASDHDIWHPRWLEVLVPVLDEGPAVVAAYPHTIRVYKDGRRRRAPGAIETAGITAPHDRLRRTAGMTAGNCIYGLFRARALAQAGVFRPVLMPDRQVLVQLSLLGEFCRVPDFLWYREVSDGFSYERQRRMFFPTHVPWHTYLPANVQHIGVLFWDCVVRGKGRPVFGRAAALRYTWLHPWYSAKRELLRRDARWRRFVSRTAVGRRLIAWSFAVQARPGAAATEGR